MYQYFKTLQSVAESDNRTFEGIKDLTIAIAQSAGYRREPVTLKNGKVVIRTKYNEHTVIDKNHVIPVWDDALVAKWLMYFRGAIIHKLSQHPELKEVHVDIIQRMFSLYFNALQIDKLKHNADVIKSVHTNLFNRIGEALFLYGSASRAKKDENAKKLKKGEITQEELDESGEEVAEHKMQNDKHAFNRSLLSLDGLIENKMHVEADYAPVDMDLLVIQLKENLKGNKIGLQLLDAMLTSNTAVRPDSIKDYIRLNGNMTEAQKTQCKIELTRAWNIIANTLRSSMDAAYAAEFDWDKKVKFDLDRTIIQKRLEKKTLNDLIKKYGLNKDKVYSLFDSKRAANGNYSIQSFVRTVEATVAKRAERLQNVALSC